MIVERTEVFSFFASVSLSASTFPASGDSLEELVQDAEVLLRLLRHPLDARLALGSEDPLFRKEAQRECQVLLPEVDGRSGLNFA